MSNWIVYLLKHKVTGRSYVGSTTNVQRRLRQHNREIVGGARSTAKGAPDWALHCWVTGFENRSQACRWEKLVKGGRGWSGREFLLVHMVLGNVHPGRGGRLYYPPEGLAFEYGLLEEEGTHEQEVETGSDQAEES